MVLDNGANLLIDDLVERIVCRHVDCAKFLPHLIPAFGVVGLCKEGTDEPRNQHEGEQYPPP